MEITVNPIADGQQSSNRQIIEEYKVHANQ
jgi:hypothetical protein